MEEILDALPPKQRACVLLWTQKCSRSEMAQILGISEEAVKRNVALGKKAVREKVLEKEKNGLKLYGLAPLPFFVWTIRMYESYTSVSAPASGTASCASILAILNEAGTASKATAVVVGETAKVAATAAGNICRIFAVTPFAVIRTIAGTFFIARAFEFMTL